MSPTSRRLLPLAAALGACLAGALALDGATAPSPPVAPLRQFPTQLGRWRADAAAPTPGFSAVLGLTDEMLRAYGLGVDTLWVYVGYSGSWRGDRQAQALHSPPVCYAAQGWTVAGRGVESLHVDGRPVVAVSTLLAVRGAQRHLVLYWFQWADRTAPETGLVDLPAKLSWLVRLPARLAAGARTDRALVRISSTVPDGDDTARVRRRQVDLAQHLLPALARHLQVPGATETSVAAR